MAITPEHKRGRPRLTVTVAPSVKERVEALAQAYPGATVSGIVEECLLLAMPPLEAVAQAMKENATEEEAQRQVEQFIGAQLLGLSDMQSVLFGKEKDG